MAIELSKKNRIIEVNPLSDKISKHTVKGWKEVHELLDEIRTRVARELKRSVEFVTCYEVGYDGFWIHRLLEENGVRNYVIEPVGVQVDRHARRVKTDSSPSGATRSSPAVTRGRADPSRSVSSALEPDRHPGFEPIWIATKIETQTEGIAIVIADRAFGLPSRERAQRNKLGNDGRGRYACARPHDVDRRPRRKAVQQIFTHVERQPLLAGLRDHEHRLTGMDVLADLGDDHGDDPIGRRPQDGCG